MSRATGSIHYRNLAKSEPMKRVLLLLLDGGWHGTREIARRADVCAVNSLAKELRMNGFDNTCDRKSPPSYRLDDLAAARERVKELLDEETAKIFLGRKAA